MAIHTGNILGDLPLALSSGQGHIQVSSNRGDIVNLNLENLKDNRIALTTANTDSALLLGNSYVIDTSSSVDVGIQFKGIHRANTASASDQFTIYGGQGKLRIYKSNDTTETGEYVTVQLENLNANIVLNIATNSYEIEQGGLAFTQQTGTAHTFIFEGDILEGDGTTPPVIRGGQGMALLSDDGFEKVIKLDQIAYPFDLDASTQSITPLGGSFISHS